MIMAYYHDLSHCQYLSPFWQNFCHTLPMRRQNAFSGTKKRRDCKKLEDFYS
jgi:hypothetical protein